MDRSKGERLRHRNAVIKGLLDVETDEVKAEIAEKRESGYFSDEPDGNSDDVADITERRRLRQVRGYQRKAVSFFISDRVLTSFNF